MLSFIKNKKILITALIMLTACFFVTTLPVRAEESQNVNYCDKSQSTYDESKCLKTEDCGFDDSGKAKKGCSDAPADVCGKGSKQTNMKFNFGCLGNAYPGGTDEDGKEKEVSPVQDLAFAFVRFFSAGVGVVVVIAVIIAGIRYSAAQANPQATAGAISQIRNALIGLLIYIFMYALLQFLVPGGAFQ